MLRNNGDKRDRHIRELPNITEKVDVPDEEVLAEVHVAEGDSNSEGKDVENERHNHAHEPCLDQVGSPVQGFEHDRFCLSSEFEMDSLGAFVSLSLEPLDGRNQDWRHVALAN